MNPTYIQHRIYLKQMEHFKEGVGAEVAPVTFNYQNFIMVASGIVQYADLQVVYQTYSCGCGPQPTIRGAVIERTIQWRDSELCAMLAASENEKDREVIDQDVVLEIYRITMDQQEAVVTPALKEHFGQEKKISFFR